MGMECPTWSKDERKYVFEQNNIDDIQEEINEFIDDELVDLGQKIMDKFNISEKIALSELKGHVKNKESF